MGQALFAGSGFAQDHGWQGAGRGLSRLFQDRAKHGPARQIGREQIKNRVRIDGVG